MPARTQSSGGIDVVHGKERAIVALDGKFAHAQVRAVSASGSAMTAGAGRGGGRCLRCALLAGNKTAPRAGKRTTGLLVRDSSPSSSIRAVSSVMRTRVPSMSTVQRGDLQVI